MIKHSADKRKKLLQRHRGIYLLPNLLTMIGLFAGFYAVVAAFKHQYAYAAMAIFIATIMDFLDGRIARLTKTQTEFGSQFDSLADMLSFGVAPALIMYAWVLHPLGKAGWLVAFFYTAAVALRLARFNTQVKVVDKRYFQGLACPAAACLLASMLWLLKDYNISGLGASSVALVTLFAGLLMVSNIRYRSFKEIRFADRIRFVYLLILVLVFMLISVNPPVVLFLGFASYALSGPVMTLLQLHKTRYRKKSQRNKSAS
ncbi:MAG: CDP-diacylglycerol--serine O-phosphatidyltransferase [Pseudomonadota bacterium]